jgi:glucokinase
VSGLAIGIDLGGTNIRVALYRDFGEALERTEQAEELEAVVPPDPVALRREPVGEPRDPADVVERLAALVESITAEAGHTGELIPVGIGIAAMLRGYDGMIAKSPHLRWVQVPFGRLLSDRLGPAHPVTVYNDVNAIAYGEFCFGAGIGARDVLAVFVGTGIGAGFVAGNRLIEGATNTAGEIGHSKVVFGDDAAPCACGGRGCVEAYIGGTYLQERIRRELTAGAVSAASTLAGGPELVNPSHLDQAAADGDDYALDLYTEIAPLLGVVLGNAVNLLNPARLILGGGVLTRAPVLREHVIASMELAAIEACLDPLTIVTTMLGDDAGLLGSAALGHRAHVAGTAGPELA